MAFRKNLTDEVAEALNIQVNVEAKAAFLYLSLASWADVRGLTGFAAWFRKEAEGEMDHMGQFVKYLNDRDFQATFQDMPSPKAKWDSVQDAFGDVRDQEHHLCDCLEKLIELAHKHSDHLTDSFLHGFVPQQIADTAEVNDIHDRLEMVGKDGHGVILIDQELGRAAAAAAGGGHGGRR